MHGRPALGFANMFFSCTNKHIRKEYNFYILNVCVCVEFAKMLKRQTFILAFYLRVAKYTCIALGLSIKLLT